MVVPPAAPEQPQTIYLLDHGRHSSLVVPGVAARLIRYEYGDWAYFARNERGADVASGALLGPSAAALGRRELAGPPSANVVRHQVRVPVEHLYPLAVERAAVRGLRGRLERIYENGRSEAVDNPRYDLEFVHHPRPYTATHNSNRVVADWLRALGCRVQGPALLARWEVRSPPNNPRAAGTAVSVEAAVVAPPSAPLAHPHPAQDPRAPLLRPLLIRPERRRE